MGSDKRGKELEEISNISNNLNYKLLLDSSALTEAIEIDLSDIINQSSILTDPSNSKQMITPKNFIATTSLDNRLGITQKASENDIINRVSNKVLVANKANLILNQTNLKISNSNLNDYVDSVYGASLQNINLLYNNKLNSNITINGQINAYFNNNTNVAILYLKNVSLPIGGYSCGSCLTILSNNTNYKKSVCRVENYNNYALAIIINRDFIAGNSYYIDFCINYNI